MKRDFETLRRSALRKFHDGRSSSSYPFISGDTYKALCDVDLNEGFDKYINENSSNQSYFFFLSGDRVSSLITYLQSFDASLFQGSGLVIHNSDFHPKHSELLFLLDFFNEIFCVNWLGSLNKVKPIPIGLENLKLMRNGVISDYQKLIRLGLPRFENRGIQILSCFSDATNPELRSEARQYFLNQNNTFTPSEFLTPRSYRKLLTNSKFVVSPPGNGDDCHRTWEAVYLGAVPIVLSSHWPFADYALPVMVVDSWSEVKDRLHDTFEPIDVDALRQLFIDSLFSR